MPRIELFQRRPENEVDPNTGAQVVGFGFGLRDITTGSPVPEGDPFLAQQGIGIVDLIALDRYPHAAMDPAFDPGHMLALVPDHNQGGAVGVWNEARHVQVGWLPGTAATVVNEALAQGWSQHAIALWAQRTPDNVRTGLRIAISTEVLPIAGHVAGPPVAAPVAAPVSVPEAAPVPEAAAAPDAWAPMTAPPDAKRGKGAIWAVVAVILAVVIAAALYFAFFRGGSEPEPTTTNQERTTTSISATTTPPTAPTTAPTTAPPTVPPTLPPTEPPPT